MTNSKLNAITLYTHFMVMALVGLLINPILVRNLGAEHFGIWKSCLRILDISSSADGRATQALKWIVANQDTQIGEIQKHRDIGAAIAIWVMWLPISLLSVILTLFSLPWLITGLNPEELFMIRIAAGLLGLNVIITALVGIPDAVLVGTNQGYRSYALTTLFLILCNIGMAISVWTGNGLIELAAITLIAQILNGAAAYTVARQYVTWWAVKTPRWQDIKRFLGFSNLVMVWSLVQAVMLSSEVLLITYIIGQSEVSRYVFTTYIGQFALSICLMTGSAVMPQLGAMLGSNEMIAFKELYDKTRRVLLLIITMMASGILLLNKAFVTLWVGPEYYMGDIVNLAMVAVLIQLVLVRFYGQVQDVGLRIGSKVLWGGIVVVLSILTGYLLFRWTDSVVMIFVGLLIGRLPLSILFPKMVNELAETENLDLRSIFALLFLPFASFSISQAWEPVTWTALIGTAILAFPVITYIAFRAFFPTEPWSSLLVVVKRRVDGK